jgi:tetratricopeptide (TPR) repeat protein
MRRLLVAVVLSLFFLASVAEASQESRQLQALGQVEFNAGRYAQALQLFDKAVAADPSDVYSRYYRGATRSRLGDLSGAISDLRAVLAAQPDLDAAALDLGVALVQSGKYRDAIPLLIQAQRNPAFDAQASLFLGIAQLRRNDIEAARANFARAAARDATLKTAATYYEGVANYRQGYTDSAIEHFTDVATSSPNSEMGRQATAFLAKIRQLERPAYEGYARVGFMYDSNVVLAPGGDVIVPGITHQSSGGVTVDLNGTYAVWRGEQAELLVGYEFFQSVYFDLADFDLNDNGPSVQLVGTADRFDYGISGRYDYYLLAGNNFLQEVNAFPWVGIPESDWGRSEAFFRMRRRDFLDPSYEVRDGFNYATGVQQYYYLKAPDDFVSVGYRFDSEQPLAAHQFPPGLPPENANQYAYNGHEISVGFGWLLPYEVSSYAGYSYHHERYSELASGGRRDEDHLATVLVSRPINQYLVVTGAFLGDFNNSNNPLYNYTREIGSIALEVRF